MRWLFLFVALVVLVNALIRSDGKPVEAVDEWYPGCTMGYPNQVNCQHWANTTPGLRVGIEYKWLTPLQLQDLANAAAAWSKAANVDVGIVGESDGSTCLTNVGALYKPGVITFCGIPPEGVGAFPPGTVFGQTNYVTLPDGLHTTASRILWGDLYPDPSDDFQRRQHFCHELGHALSLGEMAPPYVSQPGGGCMGDGNSVAEAQCPGINALLILGGKYVHADGFSTVAPQGPWTVAGTTVCPDSTELPPPTPSPTPSPTVTPTPENPFCLRHPFHWKCA